MLNVSALQIAIKTWQDSDTPIASEIQVIVCFRGIIANKSDLSNNMPESVKSETIR